MAGARGSHVPPRALYADAAVADFYARHAGLQAAEAALFEAYFPPGLDVLDLGVGGGRTTPRLSRGARSYLGLDYSEAMVSRCRSAFPELRFALGDAAAMPQLAGSSFDRVVFSFNGLDSLPTYAARLACLGECARVLRPGGVLILSVHNARYLLFPPVFADAPAWKWPWRLAYAAWRSVQLAAVRLGSRAFWRGAGYARDPATHGGLRMWIATRARQTGELRAAGFAVERVVAAPDPRTRPAVAVAWYYYACRKPDQEHAP